VRTQGKRGCSEGGGDYVEEVKGIWDPLDEGSKARGIGSIGNWGPRVVVRARVMDEGLGIRLWVEGMWGLG
jgi:hypothetical protein